MLAGNKVIITVVINGGMQQDRDGAVIPKQPAEIGEAAARCHAAGASMIHVHARDSQGKNSGDRAIYAQIIREIRARSAHPDPDDQRHGVRRNPNVAVARRRIRLDAADSPQRALCDRRRLAPVSARDLGRHRHR
jgi:hypothetical protein